MHRFCRENTEYMKDAERLYVKSMALPLSAETDTGFVKVSEKDRRYFAYTDSNPFMPIGINMAFPQSFAVSDGSEFGQSDNIAYIGLKQYETCSKRQMKMGKSRSHLVRPYLLQRRYK